MQHEQFDKFVGNLFRDKSSGRPEWAARGFVGGADLGIVLTMALETARTGVAPKYDSIAARLGVHRSTVARAMAFARHVGVHPDRLQIVDL